MLPYRSFYPYFCTLLQATCFTSYSKTRLPFDSTRDKSTDYAKNTT